MASVLDLRRRIRSVKNTRQITKAMKLVSAAKLRRAQERAIAGRPYARMLVSVIQSLVRRIDIHDPRSGDVRHPLLLSRPEKTAALIVISGDKGFAGAFNGNIFKAALRFIAEKSETQIDIEAIGRKGRDFFRRRYGSVIKRSDAGGETQGPGVQGEEQVARPVRERQSEIEVTGDHPDMLDKLSFERAAELGREIVDRYIREEMGKAARTAGVSLTAEDTREADEEASKFGTAEVDYIYEQPPGELLDGLLRQYVTTQLYRAMAESVAAEHAARMTAMDAATNNASEIIDSLTLIMNRARQAAITKEIIEIVSGAAAL